MGTTPAGYFGGEFRAGLELSMSLPSTGQCELKNRRPQPGGLGPGRYRGLRGG